MNPSPRAYWECRCDCGNTLSVQGRNLRNTHTRSCGCLQREGSSRANTKHGRSGDSIYKIWKGINDRCLNPMRKEFPHYGGRGITVCDRWHRDTPRAFENFLEDMGERPSKRHTVDRTDNDGPYSPENCRWATRRDQGNNRRTNVPFTHEGLTQTVTEWARELGINSSTVFNRIHRGVPVGVALGLEKQLASHGELP